MAQRMIANYLSFEKNPIKLIEQVIKVRKFVLKKAVEATGLPIGTILFTSVLFLGLPTGLLFRCLFRGNKFMRALMAFVLGCVMSLMTFGESTKHCAYMAIPSLLLLHLSEKTKFRSGVGLCTFLWSFGYLVYVHYTADSGGEWKKGNIDITGLLMVLTLKLTSCAMNYEDFHTLKIEEKSKFMIKHELEKVPDVLEYFAWCMFPCTLVSGPTLEFKTFRMWLREEDIFDPESPRNKLTHYKRFPRDWQVLCVLRFIGAILCLAVHLYLASIVSLTDIFAKVGFWEQMSAWEKFKIVYISGTAGKYKYYFVWMFADSACAACGLSYAGINTENSITGREGPEEWNAMTNVHPFGVDFANTFAEIPTNWNIRTGVWLRHYCYERIHRFMKRVSGNKNRKAGFVELVLTQLVSGIWHGLYAGYWMFFSSSALIIYCARKTYKWQREYMPERFVKYWKVFSLLMTHFGLLYLTPAFQLVEYTDSIRAWSGLYWCIHAVSVALILLTSIVRPTSWRMKKAVAESNAAAAAAAAAQNKVKESKKRR